jgi:hypothetical protein
MVSDPEKADLEISQQSKGQDIDCPVQHPGVSTLKDDESKKGEIEEDSIHSRSSSHTIEAVPVNEEPQQRSRSKTSSVRSRPLTIVPRSKRRGLLGRFAIIPEVERPYDYSNKIKWIITLIVALAAAAAPLGSAIFYRESTTSYTSPNSFILTLSSCSPPDHRRLEYYTNNHQSISCNVYDLHEYFPTLVVVFL